MDESSSTERHRYSSGWQIPRRAMRLGRRLRFDTIPFEDETLVGLVARATADHVLLDVNGTLRRADISMDQPGKLSKIAPSSLLPLADILGCSTSDISSRTTPPTMPDGSTSDVIFGDNVISSFDVETSIRRISPLSLSDRPYHREAWLLRILPYCPFSFELLRGNCSECGGLLGWKRSCGIGICERCELPIRPSAKPPLAANQREGYRRFAELLSSAPRRRMEVLAEMPEGIRSLDPSELIELVIDIGSCMHTERRKLKYRKRFHLLEPEQVGLIVSAGTEAVRNWPHTLQQWADDEFRRLKDNPPAYLALDAALRRLGHRPRMSDARAELVQAAFPDLFRNIQHRFANSERRLARYEAAEVLGISLNSLNELIATKAIETEVDIKAKDQMPRLDRSAIEDLRARLDASMTTALASRASGLPSYALDLLRIRGKLTEEEHPAVRQLRRHPSVTTASFRNVESKILAAALKSARPDDAVALATASRVIGGSMKPWADILAALGDGTLPCWLQSDNVGAPWLRRVLVRTADLKRFRGNVPRIPGGSRFEPVDCTLSEAREILNLESTPSVDLRQVLSELVANRDQQGPAVIVPMDDVLMIARDTISIAEICARAEWNPRHATWRLKQFAYACTECGWLRATIEAAGFF